MPTYTLATTAEPVLRDNEEGWIIEVSASVKKDGVEIASFIQRFGETVPDADMRATVEARAREIAAADYDTIRRRTRQERAAAIAANMNTWNDTLP